MSRFHRLWTLIILIMGSLTPLAAQEYSSCGKEFIFALPPNENPDAGIEPIACRIIITSAKRSNVAIETPTGEVISREMQPSSSFEYSYPIKQFLQSEIRESFKAVKKTFRVTADDSISVYVISIKDYSADGFAAVPVGSWGKEYYHVGYYDYRPAFAGNYPRGSGFIITASENDTKINIEFPVGLDSMSRFIGGEGKPKKFQITLQRGEAYPVRSKGTAPWFDFTGAHITSDKPIGLISFHLRTSLPTETKGVDYGRNHLCEALPPVYAWGKRFFTLEFNRKGAGDFFRLLASKNNTSWTCKYYDKYTGAQLGEFQGTLNAGQFYEFNQKPGSDPTNWLSIRGVAVWETSEPALLVQYSYSADWDNKRPPDPNYPVANDNYDPSMSVVLPVNMFTQNAVIRATGDPFYENWLNLIIRGDSTDTGQTALKSLTLDGKPLYQVNPKLLSQRIANTDLYWAHAKLDTGTHVLTGGPLFTGTLYGFAVENFYSYPIAASLTPLPVVKAIDSIPPKYYLSAQCGSFDITVTDSSEAGGPYQSGLKKIELLSGAQNVRLIFPDGGAGAIFDSVRASAMFSAKVEDAAVVAKGSVASYDDYGNRSLYALSYDPLDRYKVVLKLSASKSTFTPGDEIGIALDAETIGKQPDLKEIGIKIVYPADLLYLSAESIEEFNSSNGKFALALKFGLEFDTLIVNAKPPFTNLLSPDSPNTNLMTLKFLSLLPKSPGVSSAKIRLAEVATNIDECLDLTTADASVDYEICGKPVRSLEIGEPYSFKAEATTSGILVKYSLPFESSAEIEVYSTSGERVAKYYSQKSAKGESSASIDASAFSSGVYFVIFRSGPYISACKALIY